MEHLYVISIRCFYKFSIFLRAFWLYALFPHSLVLRCKDRWCWMGSFGWSRKPGEDGWGGVCGLVAGGVGLGN